MTLKTPPLHAKGVFELETPFVVVADTIYECIAIRDFADFVEKGINVFETVYEPAGLTLEDYEDDLALGANIITLSSPQQASVMVPDTYILSYPAMDHVAYKTAILSVSLGPIPDTLDLGFLKTQIAGAVEDVIGLTGVVAEHVAPSPGVISASEHEVAEIARNAAVTNRTTDRARLIAAQATIALQAVRITELEQILIDEGYVVAGP